MRQLVIYFKKSPFSSTTIYYYNNTQLVILVPFPFSRLALLKSLLCVEPPHKSVCATGYYNTTACLITLNKSRPPPSLLTTHSSGIW